MPDRIPIFRAGDRVSARDLNALADEVRRLGMTGVGRGLQVTNLPYGTVVSQQERYPLRSEGPLTVMLVERPGKDVDGSWVIADSDPLVVRVVDYAPPTLNTEPQILPGRYQFEGEPFEALPNVSYMPQDFDGMEFLGDPPTTDGAFMEATLRDTIWYVEPPTRTSSTVQSVVVRSIGLDVDNFLQVRNVKPELDAAGGWTGGYVLDGTEWEVAVHPYAQAGDYRGFIWALDALDETTPVLRAYREFGMWTLDQYFRFEVPELSRDLLFNDCTPNLIGGP